MAIPNACNSIDFVNDQFVHNWWFRAFIDEPCFTGPRTLARDDVTKKCSGSVRETLISRGRVALQLTAPVARRGMPNLIISDHGTQVISNAALALIGKTDVFGHISAPGKPM